MLKVYQNNSCVLVLDGYPQRWRPIA